MRAKTLVLAHSCARGARSHDLAGPRSLGTEFMPNLNEARCF